MSPSFFKVMVGDDFLTNLKVPPAFVKHFGGTLPEVVHLTSCYFDEGTSISWMVKTERCENGCYIRGGWPEIAKDLDLQIGDFLVFQLLSNGELEVAAYDRTCCEKRVRVGLPSSLHIPDDFEDVKVVSGPAPAPAPAPAACPSPPSSKKHRLPFFTRSLCKTDLLFLSLPVASTTEANQWDKKSAVIRSPKGQKWLVTMKLRVRTRSYRRVDISTGWSAFVRDNGLSIGSIVRFEFLGGRDNVIEARVLGRASKERARPGPKPGTKR
ncbi:hypothetical protein SAY86_014175 [Trapa natans]|uniref:TF-B3 domain-containing protein n=1 Tax=Trapa natans TaxID=22666 RepID=A0AAN7QR56_TRANT|nr:hypothetical protein SAY86_014175 [Trapa natans]